MTKRSRTKKTIYNRTGHFNSLNKVVLPQAGEANKTMKIAICIFLVLATATIYWQVKEHEFLNYDDNKYVTDNLNVQAGFTRESIHWAFTKSHYADWQPITWLSFILDYQLYGLNPTGFLLTNLFFHIVNSLLYFWFSSV